MVEQKCKWCGQSTIPQCVADTDNQILLHANCEAAWVRCREEAAGLADITGEAKGEVVIWAFADAIRAMEPPNA